MSHAVTTPWGLLTAAEFLTMVERLQLGGKYEQARTMWEWYRDHKGSFPGPIAKELAM
jgi:hypothetical protein